MTLSYPTCVSSAGRVALPLPSAETQEQNVQTGNVIGGTMGNGSMKRLPEPRTSRHLVVQCHGMPG